MDLIVRIFGGLTPYLWSWGFAFVVMTAVELVSSHDRHSLRSRIPGLLFWAIWLPVTTLVYAGFRALWSAVGVQPLLVLPLQFTWAGALAMVLAPIAAAVVYDFFFYWCHRAQHAFLWRFHAVHHSIREVNAVNSYHHITEPLFQTVLIVLPTTLIVSDTGPASAFVAIALYLHGSFIHSPVRIHMGAARVFFVDNRFHRIHHSVEERHFDKNFGAFTTLWDRLFGTAHFPAPGEWPECGLAEIDQPRSVSAWLLLPARLPRPDIAGAPMPAFSTEPFGDAAHPECAAVPATPLPVRREAPATA